METAVPRRPRAGDDRAVAGRPGRPGRGALRRDRLYRGAPPEGCPRSDHRFFFEGRNDLRGERGLFRGLPGAF